MPQPLSEAKRTLQVVKVLTMEIFALDNDIRDMMVIYSNKSANNDHCVRLALRYWTNIVASLDTSWQDFCLANTRNCRLILASSGRV